MSGDASSESAGGETPGVTSVPPGESRLAFDSGAGALAAVLQSLGLPANESEFLYDSGKTCFDAADILAAARRFPVRTRQLNLIPEQLRATPLPALGRRRDGGWVVLVQVEADHIVIQDPNAATPQRLGLADYDAIADGCVITIRPGRDRVQDFAHELASELARDLGGMLDRLGAGHLRSLIRNRRDR